MTGASFQNMEYYKTMLYKTFSISQRTNESLLKVHVYVQVVMLRNNM